MKLREYIQPKHMTLEVTGVGKGGEERVYRLRLEAAPAAEESGWCHSALDISLNSHMTEVDGPFGLFKINQPTGTHDLSLTFTNCRITEPEEQE